MRWFKKEDIYGLDHKTVYLRRWTLFSCPWFSLRLHKFLRSDEDVPHDHPWAFMSLILKGGYYDEERVDTGICYCGEEMDHHTASHDPVMNPCTVSTWCRPGMLVFRKASHTHRVVLKIDKIKCLDCLLSENDESFAAHRGMVDVLTGEDCCSCYERTRPAWTLVLTGRKVREWGFWCPDGWTPWRRFFDKGGCE